MALIKIGVVTARFNAEVTEKLLEGALETLKEKGFKPQQITSVTVPGAVEIPLACMTLFDSGCSAVVALGAVIRGETTHYDSVCQSVERGCSELQLRYKRPIGFGVLTTENEEQALARAGGNHGNKGAEAVLVALEMLDLLKSLKKRKKNAVRN